LETVFSTRDSDLRMTALARAGSSCERHQDYDSKCSVEKKYDGRESHEACRQELFGGKPLIVK
jgi:hypothetical protein